MRLHSGVYRPVGSAGRLRGPAPLARAMMAAGECGLVFFLGMQVLGDGLVPTLAGMLLAFLAAPLYLTLWLWIDRHDPEPVWALTAALAWGAGVATLVASLLNSVAAQSVNVLLGHGGSSLAAIFSAPLVEEGLKGLGIVLLLLFVRSEFDGVLDGIVYAGMIGLGFAAVENVEYYARAFQTQGIHGLAVTFYVRGMLTPFVHALFTSMTGIGCGLARNAHTQRQRMLYPLAGFCAAALLHALHNLSASLGLFPSYYLLVELPLFAALIGYAVLCNAKEARMIEQELQPELNTGLLTPQLIRLASSFWARSFWVGGAQASAARQEARRELLQCMVRLAYCCYHSAQGEDATGAAAASEQAAWYRGRIAWLKSRV